MLKDILEGLYKNRPNMPLYHYTTLSGLKGIVEDNARLFTTDINYLNDSSEIRDFANILMYQSNQFTEPKDQEVLNQFRSWIEHWFLDGHVLFVGSFSEEGNLLSQWRGYCPHGQGVSIAFRPEDLVTAAVSDGYQLGQCIYKPEQKKQLATNIISRILSGAREVGPGKKHPTQSFYNSFQEVEHQLLAIAALMKHPAFEEEKEWRVVSRVFESYVEDPFEIRIGEATMIPYRLFQLPQDGQGRMAYDHVRLGPTREHNLSARALTYFLSSRCGHTHIISPQSPFKGPT